MQFEFGGLDNIKSVYNQEIEKLKCLNKENRIWLENLLMFGKENENIESKNSLFNINSSLNLKWELLSSDSPFIVKNKRKRANESEDNCCKNVCNYDDNENGLFKILHLC
jgi:hypothetical protein